MGSIAPPSPNGEHKPVRRVYLLTSPRTASNLFVKIFNADEQPNTVQGSYHGGYFFIEAMFLRDSKEQWEVPFEEISEENKKVIGDKYQEGANRLKELLDTAKKDGQIAFVKEHVNLMMNAHLEHELAHGPSTKPITPPWAIHMDEKTDVFTSSNPLFIPDNWLETFAPTLLIRHPAIQIPSFYRSIKDGRGEITSSSEFAYENFFMTLTASRRLFDFYESYYRGQDPSSPWPLVIDAADLISHPATIMKYFCDLHGFDFSKCRFEWDLEKKEVIEAMPKINARMLSTLNASTGIQTDKANLGVDVDTEVAKWKKEFGEEVAAQLERWTRRCLPDYEYLREKRWNPVTYEEKNAADEVET